MSGLIISSILICQLLAHTFPLGRTALSGDVHFDAGELWTYGVNTSGNTTSRDANRPARDLLMTTMHEVDHSLGLQDTTDSNDVMYPVYSNNIPNPRLHDGDTKQLHSLYGANPRYTRSTKRRWRWRNRRFRKRWRFRVDRNVPRWCRMKFSDVILVSGGVGYIFSYSYVYKIDNKGVVPGYPLHIAYVFPGAPINALAVVYIRNTQKTYFFKDDRIWRFTNHTLDPGYPKFPRRRTRERPRAALSMVDHRGRNVVFIFGEKLIWRWNFYTEEANGRFHLITTYWQGLPRRLDAAVQWTDGYVYFFRINKYIKSSIFNKAALPRYPRFKGSAWLGGDCGSQPK